jgi:hypothetical protein
VNHEKSAPSELDLATRIAELQRTVDELTEAARSTITATSELTELNATIRQWETILLSGVKDILTYIAFAIGAAGTVLAWSNAAWDSRTYIARCFLVAAGVIALFGAAAANSQRGYLKRYYDRRKQLTIWDPKKPTKLHTAFRTVQILLYLLVFVGVGCVASAFLAIPPRPSVFAGARFGPGTDVSMVKGTREDFESACLLGGGGATLPEGVKLQTCR